MPQKDLFHISLSQQGANWLLRVCKITAWTIVLVSITCLLSLIGIGTRVFVFNEIVIGLALYQGLTVIIGFIQMYYYYKFTRLCRKGIELQQADLFNESFQSLLKNALTAIVLVTIEMLFTALAIFWELVVSANKA